MVHAHHDPIEPGVNGEFGHRCLSFKALCMGDILDINSDGNLIPLFNSPKSGDITRCVNVVDNLGFPQVCVDKLNVFTTPILIRQ